MPRTKGSVDKSPRKPGAGRPPTPNTYANRYRADPDGTTDVFLRAIPNAALAHAERTAAASGLSVAGWIRHLLIDREIDARML